MLRHPHLVKLFLFNVSANYVLITVESLRFLEPSLGKAHLIGFV